LAPIPSRQARIVVERDTSLLFLGAGAVVEVGGARIGTIGRGGSVSRDVAAGPVTVKVRAVASAGQFVVRFNAKAGKTYRFMVSPRSDQMLLGAAFGAIGDAVSADISENSGYFQIAMVP